MATEAIDQIIQKLEVIIEECKNEESNLGYFAALYHGVTVTVKEKLHTNYFDDDKRMEQLDVVFANRYLDAYDKYKAGKPITKSWECAFQFAQSKNLIVLQHLLLGMNAHINLDLGIAAAEISNQDSIENLASDFNKINEILSSLVDDVQNDLAKIWPNLLKILKQLNKVDNFIINFSMNIARDGAWKFATSIVGLNDPQKEVLISKRDLKIEEFAKKITNYGLIIKIAFFIIRIGERGKTSDKITALELKIDQG